MAENKELDKLLENLSDKERAALRYFYDNKQVPIPSDKVEALFNLYKVGKTCDEIRKLNPASYSLGQIVAARIAGGWDLKIQQDREELVLKLPGEVVQVQSEAIDFMARMLMVNHRLYSDKIDKYLATNDPVHLIGLPKGFGDLKEYRATLDALIKATGQSNRKVVEHRGNVSVSHVKPITSEEAGEFLDVMVIETDKKD